MKNIQFLAVAGNRRLTGSVVASLLLSVDEPSVKHNSFKNTEIQLSFQRGRMLDLFVFFLTL